MDNNYLPHGSHWGLRINTAGTVHTGPMAPGCLPKLILHTTEGNGFSAMDGVLRNKGAEPHVLIDPGTRDVKQYMPFDQYAKALEHPTGTPETNRAGAIQIEIVGFAAPSAGHRDVAEESLDWYMNLGALCQLILHRVPIRAAAPRPFRVGAPRISPRGFARANGIYGHMHVPSQPAGHWDPGRLKIEVLLDCMKQAELDHA